MSIPLNIDWQQILLHILNFIILAGGLWFLLYKPVKKFMDGRTEYYKKMDEDAAEKLKSAEEKEKEYSQKLELAENEAENIKAEAAKQAEKSAQAELLKAETEKQKIIESAKKSALEEKEKILNEANSQIEKIVSDAIDEAVAGKSADPIDDFLKTAGKE